MSSYIFVRLILLHTVIALNVPEYITLFTAASKKSSSSGSANYDCIFTNLWTKSRHPNDYPSDAHWSPAVIISHDSVYSMFKEGEKSTEGFKIVAEKGAPTKLVSEAESYGDSILSIKVGKLMDGIRLTANQKITNIEVDNSHPYLSMVSMVAPSPDWITGLNDFDMRTGNSNEKWRQEVVLDLFPWDAGTDSGTSYASPNEVSNGNIMQLTIDTIPKSTKVFESPEEVTVLPVARFQCQLNGMAAKKCKRNITQKCKKRKKCCPGLACMRQDNTGRKKMCLPKGYEGQKCKRNKDCVKSFRCNNKRCA